MSSSVQLHREALQRRTGTDWAQREYIELISGRININDDVHVISLPRPLP